MPLAQLCCDPFWTTRADNGFQEFRLQVWFECVSKDRPALLRVIIMNYCKFLIFGASGTKEVEDFSFDLYSDVSTISKFLGHLVRIGLQMQNFSEKLHLYCLHLPTLKLCSTGY